MTNDPYDVRRVGTDSSGRAILMNARMILALEVACRSLPFTPTITQGAYMSRVGGGAADSAGYHDGGGCLDFRTTSYDELNNRQIDHLVAALRSVGWAAWRRDQAHGGMDPHCHAVLLGDRDAAGGAKYQMTDYIAGGDGMGGADYEQRPDPLVTGFDYHAQLQEDALLEQLIKEAIKADGDKTRRALGVFRQNAAARDTAMADELEAIRAELADLPADKQDRILARLARIRDALNEQPEETP